MDILEKLTKKLVFWLDGDKAGIDAMRKALPRLLARGFRVMVLISNGRDPAEQMIYMRKNGKAIKRYIADRAVPARIMLAEEAFRDYEIQLQQLKADVLDELLPVMNVITDDTERILFRNMIEERLGVSI
ncbi:DNA primase [compost metagenome]